MLNEFVYTFNKMKQRYEEKERFIWFKFRDNIIYILCYYNIYICYYKRQRYTYYFNINIKIRNKGI